MSDRQPDNPWFAPDGLRFECTECGACCTGPPGAVRFDEQEADAISERLGITRRQFLDRYTRVAGRSRSLIELETFHGFDCVFLDREAVPGKAVCAIYDVRPTQCRTFPWWREHTRSPKAWARAARACEGVNRGAFVPVEQITREIDRQRRADVRAMRG
ncbi:MAG: YkgJ family cysteine cluster protein [Planctomycetota bacterium]